MKPPVMVPFRYRCRDCKYRGKGMMSERIVKEGRARRYLICVKCHSDRVILGD